MVADRPSNDRAGEDPWRRIEVGLLALGAAGLVLYALVRRSYDAFYQQFGLTPEEVGVTYAGTVAAAGLGLLAIVALAAAVLSAVHLGQNEWRRRRLPLRADRLRPRTWGRAAAGLATARRGGDLHSPHLWLAAAGVALVFLTLLWAFWDSFLVKGVLLSVQVGVFAVLTTVFLLAGAVAWLKYVVRRHRIGGDASANPVRPPALAKVCAGGALMSLILLELVISAEWGEFTARRVQGGQLPNPSLMFGAISLEATPVCVRWTGPLQAPPALAEWRERPLVYLGRSGGALVLHEPRWNIAGAAERGGSTFRVPASAVVLDSPLPDFAATRFIVENVSAEGAGKSCAEQVQTLPEDAALPPTVTERDQPTESPDAGTRMANDATSGSSPDGNPADSAEPSAEPEVEPQAPDTTTTPTPTTTSTTTPTTTVTTPATSSAPPVPAPDRMTGPPGPIGPPGAPLRPGSRGYAVQLVQEWLNARSAAAGAGPPLAVDGRFGPLTAVRTAAFQRATAIPVDGVVGPLTWLRLQQP